MNYVNTFKKVLLAAGIILLMPMVLSASVFAERRQVEGYGSANVKQNFTSWWQIHLTTHTRDR